MIGENSFKRVFSSSGVFVAAQAFYFQGFGRILFFKKRLGGSTAQALWVACSERRQEVLVIVSHAFHLN